MLLRNASTLCAFGVLGLMAQSAHADGAPDKETDRTFSLDAGLTYSSGKYGASSNTDIAELPLTLGYDVGDWSFSLDLPYIYVSGPDNVIPGVGQVENKNPKRRGHKKKNVPPSQTPPVSVASASGMGDIDTSVTYTAFSNDTGDFSIDLTGAVKFGTASANEGLGTGQNDYSFNVDVYKNFGMLTLTGGVGYTWLGSSPNIRLNDVWTATGGVNYRLTNKSSFGAYYDYQEKASRTSFAQNEVAGYYSYKFARAWKAKAYVSKGFTAGSPDWGVGATVFYSF